MALRVQTGIAIPVGGKSWPVPLYAQQATEWCWLACAQMAGDTPPRGAKLQQCDLAEKYIEGAAGCCATKPPPDVCNDGGSADTIEKIYAGIPLGFDPAPVLGQPDEPELIEWLLRGPVQVFWKTPDLAHVALIVGVQQVGAGNYQYTLNDPWPVGSGQVRMVSYDRILPTIPSGFGWDWQCCWHCPSAA